MFFKPYKGICRCHNKERWILNKKGECNETVSDRKKNKKSDNKKTAIQRKGSLRSHRPILKKSIHWNKKPIAKKVKKATGEKDLFIEIWKEECEKSYPDCPKCRCCKAPLGFEPKPIFFSHLLSKGAYPSFRLIKRNIWICCPKCHGNWETGNKEYPELLEKREEALRLKQLYYLKQIP